MIRIGVYCLFIRLIYCGSKTCSIFRELALVPSILSTITPMSVTVTLPSPLASAPYSEKPPVLGNCESGAIGERSGGGAKPGWGGVVT